MLNNAPSTLSSLGVAVTYQTLSTLSRHESGESLVYHRDDVSIQGGGWLDFLSFSDFEVRYKAIYI